MLFGMPCAAPLMDAVSSGWTTDKVELVHMPSFSGTPRDHVLIYHGEWPTARTSLEVFEESTLQWRRHLTHVSVQGSNGYRTLD